MNNKLINPNDLNIHSPFARGLVYANALTPENGFRSATAKRIGTHAWHDRLYGTFNKGGHKGDLKTWKGTGNNYLRTGVAPLLTEYDITLSIWAIINNSPAALYTVIFCVDNGNSRLYLDINSGGASGRLGMAYRDNVTGINAFVTRTDLYNGSLVHMVGVLRNGTSIDYYLNGEKVQTATNVAMVGLKSSSRDYWIGCRNNNGSPQAFMQAGNQLLDARLWEYDLTDEMIKNMYDEGPYGNLYGIEESLVMPTVIPTTNNLVKIPKVYSPIVAAEFSSGSNVLRIDY